MGDDIVVPINVSDVDMTGNQSGISQSERPERTDLDHSVEHLQFVLRRLNHNSSLGNNPELLESIEKVLAVVNATDEYKPTEHSFLDRLSQVD